MYVASISFGIGSLLVSAGLKATPEEWLDKIRFGLREVKTESKDDEDFIDKMSKRRSSKTKKDELERLL